MDGGGCGGGSWGRGIRWRGSQGAEGIGGKKHGEMGEKPCGVRLRERERRIRATMVVNLC